MSRKLRNVCSYERILALLFDSASVSNAEDELDNERKILAQLNHQNIVSLVAALEGSYCFFFPPYSILQVRTQSFSNFVPRASWRCTLKTWVLSRSLKHDFTPR